MREINIRKAVPNLLTSCDSGVHLYILWTFSANIKWNTHSILEVLNDNNAILLNNRITTARRENRSPEGAVTADNSDISYNDYWFLSGDIRSGILKRLRQLVRSSRKSIVFERTLNSGFSTVLCNDICWHGCSVISAIAAPTLCGDVLPRPLRCGCWVVDHYFWVKIFVCGVVVGCVLRYSPAVARSRQRRHGAGGRGTGGAAVEGARLARGACVCRAHVPAPLFICFAPTPWALVNSRRNEIMLSYRYTRTAKWRISDRDDAMASSTLLYPSLSSITLLHCGLFRRPAFPR